MTGIQHQSFDLMVVGVSDIESLIGVSKAQGMLEARGQTTAIAIAEVEEITSGERGHSSGRTESYRADRTGFTIGEE